MILEARDRIGDTWRRRWDSLRLFTPARFDGLDGMPFPAPRNYFPTKDQMADYLEAYATRFALPVRTGVRVKRLSSDGGRYQVESSAGTWEAEHVVVAMASYQHPKVPAFAARLGSDIVQLHSREYRNLSQLEPGGVLLVGRGQLGRRDRTRGRAGAHPTWLSGRNTGHIPFRIEGPAARIGLLRFVFRVVFHRVLTTATPIGRKARPAIISKGGPLIRIKTRDLAAVGRRAGAADGGRERRAAGARGRPGARRGQRDLVHRVPSGVLVDRPAGARRERGAGARPGVVAGQPGLYFTGLHFLFALSSTMIHGAGRDAEHIAETIRLRTGAARREPRTDFAVA